MEKQVTQQAQPTEQYSGYWRDWRVENCEDYNPKGIFNIYPPASPNETATLIKKLIDSFKEMRKEEYTGFWKELGEQLKELSWSKERIRYAVNRMIRKHQYPTFTIADFLMIDKELKVFTYEEADRLENHPPLVKVKLDKWYIIYEKDAIEQQLPYERWYSTVELKELGKI